MASKYVDVMWCVGCTLECRGALRPDMLVQLRIRGVGLQAAALQPAALP